jgi:tetratricopeptide (TPR) repeat protein
MFTKITLTPILLVCWLVLFLFTAQQGFAVNPQAQELYEKGTEYRYKDLKKALKYLKDALEKETDYVEALLQAGEISRALDLYDQAEQYYKQVETLLTQGGETETENYARLLRGYGSLYTNQWKNTSGSEYYEKALNLLEKLHKSESELYAGILIDLSSDYNSQANTDKALNLTQKAESILKKITTEHENMLFHMLYKIIGNIYCSKAQPDLALDFYEKAKNYLEKDELHNSYDMACVLNNFGWAFYLLKDYNKALDYYLKAYTLLKNNNVLETSPHLIVLLNIIAIHYIKSEWSTALEYSLTALSTMEKMKITKYRKYADTFFNAGFYSYNLYRTSKNKTQLNNAEKYYLKAKTLYEELAIVDQYYGILLLDLGIIAEIKGKKSVAGPYYRKAYNIFVQVGYTGPYKSQALESAQRMGY